MGLHDGAAGDASDLIRVAGGLHALFARFTRFRLVAIFEAFENLDRSPDRTFRATGFAWVASALRKSSSRTRPAYHLVAKVRGDAFGAVATESNLFLEVDHADSDLQAIQKASTDMGIFRGGHRLPVGRHSTTFIGTNPPRLQEMKAVRRLNSGSGAFSIR